jgi:hypothetical protein
LPNSTVATRQIVHIADVAAVRDPNDRDPRYLALLGAAAVRTMLLVPMLKEEDIGTPPERGGPTWRGVFLRMVSPPLHKSLRQAERLQRCPRLASAGCLDDIARVKCQQMPVIVPSAPA